MYPTLITFGQIHLQTASVFAVLALLFGGFVLWRKSREEHYSESVVFDGFLLAIMFGFFVGRVTYGLVHWDQFGTDLLKWFDVVSYPGTQFMVGMAAAGWYLARYAINKRWDMFEVLDFWVIATSLSLAFRHLGSFFEGSWYGLPTTLPWGVVFPQTQEAVHPTQLYFSVFFLGLFWYLSRVEYQYRSFEWYRYGKKTAQTGFLFAVAVIATSLFSLVMSLVSLPEFMVAGVALDGWLYGLGAVLGGVVLWVRSGRKLWS